MKATVKQMRERERKFGNLENKLKDMEDEQLILIEQHQEQLKSRQAMFQYQLDDSKRRNLELEEKLTESKQLIEQLKQQAKAPVQDTPNATTAAKGNRNESEEVLHLHEQLTDLHAQLTA